MQTHDDHILAVLAKNAATARRTIVELASRVPDAAASPASSALEHAIITARDRITPEARDKLAPLIGKYL